MGWDGWIDELRWMGWDRMDGWMDGWIESSGIEWDGLDEWIDGWMDE